MGIRNKLLVLYTVNCSGHIAHAIGKRLRLAGLDVDVAGNESCYDNQAMVDQLLRLSIHPNVGAVLAVGHGCEFIQAEKIVQYAKQHGRLAKAVYGQRLGTKKCLETGVETGRQLCRRIGRNMREETDCAGLTVGFTISAFDETVCHGLPILETVCTHLTGNGVGIVLPERFLCGLNLKGIETSLPSVAELQKKAEHFYVGDELELPEEWKAHFGEYVMEKAAGYLKIAQIPRGPGLWFSDSLPDSGQEKGPVNGGIVSELMQFVGNGAVLNLMLTGSGTPVGSAVAPTVIITGNEETKRRMEEDVDLLVSPERGNAEELIDLICQVMGGKLTAPERNGQSQALLYQNEQNRRRCDECLER